MTAQPRQPDPGPSPSSTRAGARGRGVLSAEFGEPVIRIPRPRTITVGRPT